MEVFIITIILLLIAVTGISVKILIKKNEKFSGTCASNNPMLNKDGEACGFCGALPDEQCNNS